MKPRSPARRARGAKASSSPSSQAGVPEHIPSRSRQPRVVPDARSRPAMLRNSASLSHRCWQGIGGCQKRGTLTNRFATRPGRRR